MRGRKTTGMFQGRKINRIGVELIVLSKSDAEWRIRAIHWSDRKAKRMPVDPAQRNGQL